ncbi:MAG: ROK family transcriptional regulator [Oscillospiraceae bacterium]|jgi:DNA-binding transcriptional ArsR family regulator|nr:ROK family transcriptional regulator [Oscillospiraceae bacterium]
MLGETSQVPETSGSMTEQRTIRRKIIDEHYDTINGVRRLSVRNTSVNRTQLADAMGVSLSTVSRDIKKLLEARAIREEEDSSLKICSEFAYFLGIQISTHVVRAALLGFDLQPMGDQELVELINSTGSDGDAFVQDLWDLDPEDGTPWNGRKEDRDSLRKLAKPLPFIFFNIGSDNDIGAIIRISNHIVNKLQLHIEKIPLLAVGLATPGLMDGGKVIRFCPNVQALVNHSIYELLNTSKLKDHNIKSTFIHDTSSDMLWIKEMIYEKDYNGDADEENVAVIHVGSGVGSALVLGGALYHGKNGCAGEIGHFFTPPENAKLNELIKDKRDEDQRFSTETAKEVRCSCENACIESTIRKEIFDSFSPSVFFEKNEIRPQPGSHTPEAELLKQYFEKRPARLRLFVEYMHILGNQMINFANVGLIVFSGRLAPALKEEIAAHNLRFHSVQNIASSVCTIRAGDGWVESVARGAAIAAFHKCLEENEKSDDPVRVQWKPLRRVN